MNMKTKPEFKDFRNEIQKHFAEMTKDASHLFEVNIDKDEFWNLYLDSFPAGTNEIYRTRREYDCSCCRHFIKQIGNVVAIKNGKVHTIWDVELKDDTFQVVADALKRYILNASVLDVFLTPFTSAGTDQSMENINGEINRYDHFYLDIPSKYTRRDYDYINSEKATCRDTKNVFKRSLDEITQDSVKAVLELIAQNSLYKGNEWESILKEFLKLQKEYAEIALEERDLWCWEKSVTVGMDIGRMRNRSIGTLLMNISEGMDLDTAVKKYEQIVAPANYKRPKPIFTQKMLEDAKKTIVELGYLDSLKRRYATLDDITVNNILFSNKDASKRIKGALDIFEEMGRDAKTNAKKFSKVEEVSVDTFVNEILPVAREIEVYFENKHASNMVSLIAPEVSNSKTMFKWDNNFGWAYTGNMTDSMLKENVKAAGGKVDGDLRFSIQWNDTSEYSKNDLDAHCIEASGEHIYYASIARKPGFSMTGGQLDVDITSPRRGVPAVENITWADRKRMKPGVYKFYVHGYSNRGGRDGFRAEIEFDGQIYAFDYRHEVRTGEDIMVAEVTLHNDYTFTIDEKLPSTTSSKEVWGLNTNEFVPVSVICYSPNYWDEQNGNGNKHIFFMLKNCINNEEPNGYYNEFLKSELTKHRKVFEALGAKCKVDFVDDQLSGIGFSLTKRAELIVKVVSSTERVVKIKF